VFTRQSSLNCSFFLWNKTLYPNSTKEQKASGIPCLLLINL
jgi:hypothetical protein